MLLCLLGSELVTCLKAGDGLVLRTVIHEGALDVGHQRYEPEICEEDRNLHRALEDCCPHAELAGEEVGIDNSREEIGQEHKEEQ